MERPAVLAALLAAALLPPAVTLLWIALGGAPKGASGDRASLDVFSSRGVIVTVSIYWLLCLLAAAALLYSHD